jgi:hypothetical protein
MQRRKFIAAAAVTSITAPFASAKSISSPAPGDNEIYELRTYEMTWGGNQSALMSFLKDVEGPYLKDQGANHFMIFNETSQSQPTNLWVLSSFPDFSSYQQAIANRTDDSYLARASSYADAGKIYNRISSSLLYAFDGLKQMKTPIERASLFELRIYEGVNEDAVRRKIKMFDDEELELFYKVDLNPIFFGQMITGPYVPSLVYMLNYRDMDHRDKAWKDFLEHPDWNVMKVKPEYANTVSNIRRVYLELNT